MGAEVYPWIKALHIIAVISWMAGLLYLPRLFVYHCGAEAGSDKSETFKVMELRLLKVIMRPAMIASWGLGIFLLAIPGVVDWSGDCWVYGKLALVAGLTWVHMMFSGYVRAFAEDRNEKPERYFRVINEVPTLIMIGVVILVTVKPF
ncbi:MAG: protoporphyrinogen oxidase HemJ [Hyphomicrobiales bacterium]